MTARAIECGHCGAKAHYVEQTFMGCCSAGHCENEGYKTVEEWNADQLLAMEARAKDQRSTADHHIRTAELLEIRIDEIRRKA